MVKEVKAWMTSDNRVFIDKEEAEERETIGTILQWFNNNEIGNAYEITFDSFICLLKEHKAPLMDFLNRL